MMGSGGKKTKQHKIMQQKGGRLEVGLEGEKPKEKQSYLYTCVGTLPIAVRFK
jgi:hypothetical protein